MPQRDVRNVHAGIAAGAAIVGFSGRLMMKAASMPSTRNA
jgi:hypothetical protein